jgi:hypothetical protein
MKQTALMELLQWVRATLPMDLDTPRMIEEKIESLLPMEKEQMIGFAEYVAGYPDKNRNHLGQMLHAKSKYDGAERTVDLLEQYYNETYAK